LSPGEPLWRYPITGIAGCCARAASGQAPAAPPRSVMNCRRFMCLDEAVPDDHLVRKIEAVLDLSWV
jgi:hypothetical protein